MDIPERDDSPIESLRASIEKDYKFRTSFSGFDKTEVKKYLTDLDIRIEEMTSSLEEQIESLRCENAELAGRNSELERNADEIRREERRKLEAEMLMQEGVAANLRQTNAKLVEENRCKDIEIADLKKRIDLILKSTASGGDDMYALCASLRGALEEKFAGCLDLVSAWKGEAEKVLENVSRQIVTENGKEAVICPGLPAEEEEVA